MYDVVVVGAGVFGAWAAIAAAKADKKVAILEQYEPGNDQGSSDQDGQIYRFACSDDVYVDMMSFSLPRWKELQEECGDKLMAETGFLTVSDTSVPTKFDLGDALERKKIDYKLMTPEESGQRFPQIKLHAGLNSLFVPDGGILFASQCITAAWDYCKSLGADPFTGFRVTKLNRDKDADCVEVESEDGQRVRAKRLILAPGAWLSHMAKDLLGVDIPTEVTAETVCHYKPREGQVPDHSISSMPGFCFETDNGLSSQGYYGMPDIYESGVTVGADCTGPEIDPEERPVAAGGEERQDDDEEFAANKRKFKIIQSCNYFISTFFPHLESKPDDTRTSLYTITPSHDYIISKVSEWGNNVVLIGGGSGHGFKMGPAVGYSAIALAFGKDSPVNLEKFSLENATTADD